MTTIEKAEIPTTEGASMTLVAIDEDPEMFHGLTIWTDVFSVQVRDGSVVFFDRLSEQEREVSKDDARHIRDLLNIATARGAL